MTLIPACWREVQHQFKTVWPAWLLGIRPRSNGVGLGHQKTQVQFLAPTTVCNSSSRESNTFFWPLQVPGTHMVHRQTCRQNTYTHKAQFSERAGETAQWLRVLHVWKMCVQFPAPTWRLKIICNSRSKRLRTPWVIVYLKRHFEHRS